MTNTLSFRNSKKKCNRVIMERNNSEMKMNGNENHIFIIINQ